MRSQVARHVLRRPPVTRSLATLHLSSAPRPAFRVYPVGCRVTRTAQRRSFFNLFEKPPRTLRSIEAEPGYETLLTFAAAEQDALRLPSIPDLEQAWDHFFVYKEKHGRPVNTTQALCVRRVLDHFCQPSIAPSVNLSIGHLHLALRCLQRPPKGEPTHHLDLARALFREIRRRELKIDPGFHPLTLDYRLKGSHARSRYAHAYLIALSQYGAALEAKDFFLENLPAPNRIISTSSSYRRRRDLYVIIKGLAQEGQEEALRDIVLGTLNIGIRYDVFIHGVMTEFFARRDNFEETNYWFSKPIRRGFHPSPATYYEVLRFALRNDRKEWAFEIYKELMTRLEGNYGSFKALWDVSFQFAFLLMRKGTDEIERMLHVAKEHTKDFPQAQPNIRSINGLVKCALDQDDAYTAERLIALSIKLGYEPDFTTYKYQMRYRLVAKDLSGAFAAFQSIRSRQAAVTDGEWPILNQLIRALCELSHPDYVKILDVTSYLEHGRVTLEPETVVSICMAFLRNDETYEVIDTLSIHTAYYSIAERRKVRKAFVQYCLDRKNSTSRIWDAYALVRQFFPEMERDYREDIMDTFFARRRPDMACHVFGHMRSHDNPRCRPTVKTYVRCFEGIGACPDPDSLRTIHNMLKMDTNIQLSTTEIFNALMIGYIACDKVYRALDFWKEVTLSQEGPSYATLEIVMRAYELQPYGDTPAMELWNKMIKMDLDIPEHVYAAYAATLAAHSHVQEMKDLLEDHDSIIGRRPDLLTFAYAYNALPSQEMKEQFEAWAQHEFPPIWTSLIIKHQRRSDEDGLLHFKVSRPWKA
ncbi:complex I intermediate-associated protein [Xylaria sp. CBS 124048]|nr:complex I intermediate-associated protein [Xylaria sp. CBS 124048]